MHSDGIGNYIFGTAEKTLKTIMSLKHAFWRYLKWFGTAEKNENNVSKACVLTRFETIWNCRENLENVVS